MPCRPSAAVIPISVSTERPSLRATATASARMGRWRARFSTWQRRVRNCVRLLGVALPDALRFASAHPATFVGLGQTLGKLAPGYRADLVAFEPTDITVLATWVAGQKIIDGVGPTE